MSRDASEQRPDPDQRCAMGCGKRIGENPKRTLVGLICPVCARDQRVILHDPRLQDPR